MISEKEYIQRVLGRLECYMSAPFHPNDIETIEKLLKELCKGVSSAVMDNRGSFAVLRLPSGRQLEFPTDFLLVVGYNQFDLEKEFSSEY